VTSLPILGKSTMIHTSSTFLKGARPAKLNVAPGIGAADKDLLVAAETTRATSAALAATSADRHTLAVTGAKDALAGPQQRLVFRLTEPLLLPQQDQ